MLNCYDATRLMSEKLDRPLGRLEKLNLRLHLFICKSCGHFDDHMQHLRLLTLWLPEPHAHDLPPDLQAILKYGVEASATANTSKAMRVYSEDLQKLQNEAGVTVLRTPKEILDAQIVDVRDEVVAPTGRALPGEPH